MSSVTGDAVHIPSGIFGADSGPSGGWQLSGAVADIDSVRDIKQAVDATLATTLDCGLEQLKREHEQEGPVSVAQRWRSPGSIHEARRMAVELVALAVTRLVEGLTLHWRRGDA